MPKISIVLTTARHSKDAMVDFEGIDLFSPTMISLISQTFTDFELVVVDALYHERPDRLSCEYKFDVKHVPFTLEESRWLHRGMWNNVQMRNKGIVHSDGELVVFAGDCSEFSPRAMEKYWMWHKKGFMPQAVFRWAKGRRLVEDKRDHRWKELDMSPQGILIHSYPSWFFEYASVPLKLLLKVNGFDENFDGVKALEDVEIAMRMSQLGYNRYILDQELYVTEYVHHPLPADLFQEDHAMRQGGLKWEAPASAKYTKAFKDAYSIMMFNERHHRWKANTEPLTDQDLIEIKTFSNQCFEDGTLTGNRYIWDQSRHYEYWKNNQPVFDLNELWEERIRQK